MVIIGLLGILGFIAYDQYYNKDTEKPNNLVIEEDKPQVLTEDEALQIGKSLYLNARDNYYNVCTLAQKGAVDTYDYEDENLVKSEKGEKYTDITDYILNNTIFTEKALKQWEKTNKKILKTNDNRYYISSNQEDCGQGYISDSTEIKVIKIKEDKIKYEINEYFCESESESTNNCLNTKENLEKITTNFTIVKENEVWKIYDYTDSYNEYLR